MTSVCLEGALTEGFTVMLKNLLAVASRSRKMTTSLEDYNLKMILCHVEKPYIPQKKDTIKGYKFKLTSSKLLQ